MLPISCLVSKSAGGRVVDTHPAASLALEEEGGEGGGEDRVGKACKQALDAAPDGKKLDVVVMHVEIGIRNRVEDVCDEGGGAGGDGGGGGGTIVGGNIRTVKLGDNGKSLLVKYAVYVLAEPDEVLAGIDGLLAVKVKGQVLRHLLAVPPLLGRKLGRDGPAPAPTLHAVGHPARLPHGSHAETELLPRRGERLVWEDPVPEARNHRIGAISSIGIRQLEEEAGSAEDAVGRACDGDEGVGVSIASGEESRPDITDDDAASRQSCVVVNSAIVDGAEMEERVFGWGVIGMQDDDGVSLYKQLEPFADVAGLAIGDPAGQRFSSTEQQYTTITTIGDEC